MRNFTKKSVSMLAISGAAMLTTGCGGHGPNTYLMPKAAVLQKLEGAERTFSFMGDKDAREVRSTSVRGDTVNVKLKYTTGALGTFSCQAHVEAIDEEWTRVTPSCVPKSNGAEGKVQAEISKMQVDEFVIAVLYDREVDSAMVLKRTSAVAIDNLDSFTDEAAAEAAAIERIKSQDSGWRDDGSSW